MSRRRFALAFALVLLACALLTSGASGAARFYTPDYGSSTPEEIGGFDLGADGSLTPIPGSPFPAAPGPPYEPAGIWGLGFTPDGTRAASAFLFYGGVQGYSVPASGIFSLAGNAIQTPSVTGLAVSPDGRFAFAPTRDFGGAKAEGIRRFAIAADGSLSALSPPGGSGEYGEVVMTPDGRFLFVVPASGGGLDVFAIDAAGGLEERGPGVLIPGSSPDIPGVSVDGRFVYLPDSNNDAIFTIAIAPDGRPSIAGEIPVEDPESVSVSPDGRHLVVYRGSGGDALQTAAIGADGIPVLLPFESPWDTGEPERLVFQPHLTPVAKATVKPAAPRSDARFDASGSERAARFDWDFGDGVVFTNGPATVTHAYAKPGVYKATLTVADTAGCSARQIYSGQSTVCPGGAAATTTVTVDTLPEITRAKAVPKKFAPKQKGVKAGKVKLGTTFRYVVSEPATVRFKIERKKIGRLVGKKCKPRTPKNAGRKNCPLFKVIGSRSQVAKAGANRLRWNGKLKGKPLSPGSYRATVIATDNAGGRSAPKTVGFRILPLSR